MVEAPNALVVDDDKPNPAKPDFGASTCAGGDNVGGSGLACDFVSDSGSISAPPSPSGRSCGCIIPGYGPASGYWMLKDTINPSWLYTSNLGGGGRSGRSSPPSIPLTTGFVTVRSISIARTDVSSWITPFFAAGRTPRAASSRKSNCHFVSPSSVEACIKPISDARPEAKKVRCLEVGPHCFRSTQKRCRPERSGNPIVSSTSKNLVYVIACFVR